MTIEIRLARPSDSGRIAALYDQLVGNPLVSVVPERIAALSSDPNAALFVCEHEGDVMGTALVSLCPDAMFGFQPFAVVENVVVSKERRGQGIGAALMRHVERFCLSKDCSKVMLLSSAERRDAHRFFEKAGYGGSTKVGFVKYRREFQESLE